MTIAALSMVNSCYIAQVRPKEVFQDAMVNTGTITSAVLPLAAFRDMAEDMGKRTGSKQILKKTLMGSKLC